MSAHSEEFLQELIILRDSFLCLLFCRESLAEICYSRHSSVLRDSNNVSWYMISIWNNLVKLKCFHLSRETPINFPWVHWGLLVHGIYDWRWVIVIGVIFKALENNMPTHKKEKCSLRHVWSYTLWCQLEAFNHKIVWSILTPEEQNVLSIARILPFPCQLI